MSFIIDKQSLEDLNLLGKYKTNSIYSIFNTVTTSGGEKLLESMFLTPMHDPEVINQRAATFQFFQKQELAFSFDKQNVADFEQYLTSGKQGSWFNTATGVIQEKIAEIAIRSIGYSEICKGIEAAIRFLNDFSIFWKQLKMIGAHPYQKDYNWLDDLLDDPKVLQAMSTDSSNSIWDNIRFHFLFKNTIYSHLKRLLQTFYELDVYISVAAMARRKGMGYATACAGSSNRLRAVGLRHPALDKAVCNSISLHQSENVLFLTGANMAGKSTWMKTIGVTMYLAHLGMPVAASEFEFSVRDGIYSSINVPDDIDQGYSHFYAEVLRVKTVAQKVSDGKNLLILFDELFKGTNVKDAFDATLAVTKAFAVHSNCLFVISTHILEVGEELARTSANIQFRYLPTVLEGTSPRYTYYLTEGISSDRQGMMIIENEGILGIIAGE
ncbi:MutS-related protein [Sphingobacterium faecale]|uniref:DNA mismatch repair protein n=1 Tax=Sphingobacterium faecale TaxID=2803775 RepID=A0ABS1R795_9SPHI|nr:DNA mismatch repair protein [Sphingobacterium faecale]MBL1410582.1 DNA mismatch repair protein [Sphingobacterium faecale]